MNNTLERRPPATARRALVFLPLWFPGPPPVSEPCARFSTLRGVRTLSDGQPVLDHAREWRGATWTVEVAPHDEADNHELVLNWDAPGASGRWSFLPVDLLTLGPDGREILFHAAERAIDADLRDAAQLIGALEREGVTLTATTPKAQALLASLGAGLDAAADAAGGRIEELKFGGKCDDRS